jgi:hypothetical protein
LSEQEIITSTEQIILNRLAELMYLLRTSKMKISKPEQFSQGMEQKEGYLLSHKRYHVWLVKIEES